MIVDIGNPGTGIILEASAKGVLLVQRWLIFTITLTYMCYLLYYNGGRYLTVGWFVCVRLFPQGLADYEVWYARSTSGFDLNFFLLESLCALGCVYVCVLEVFDHCH